MVTCVLMTKKQLDKYVELLDCRIEFLKTRQASGSQEYSLLVSMRDLALDAYDSFR